jgi:hypothetical protein
LDQNLHFIILKTNEKDKSEDEFVDKVISLFRSFNRNYLSIAAGGLYVSIWDNLYY